MRIPKSLVVALAPAALVLAACSTSTSVSQSDVEAQVKNGVVEEIGLAAEDVTVACPGDLEAKAGTTMTCTVTAGEESGDILVTVNTVDGSDVNLDWEIVSSTG